MVNKITTPPSQNEVIGKINELVDGKQDTLVSGTNIKTVGGTSLLGSGDVAFPTVDQTYSASSTNAQSGVAVANAIAPKQDTLVSGTNIKTINGNSLLGSGNIVIETSSTPNVDGETISYNSSDALQAIAVKNVRDGSTLPIWHGTEYQWNHGDPTTWYYWQTSVTVQWVSGGNISGVVPYSFSFQNNLFISCRYRYAELSNGINSIVYSTDNCETWQNVTISPIMQTKPIYGDGVFVMAGTSAAVYSTDNCETWQNVAYPNSIVFQYVRSLCYGNKCFIALLQEGRIGIYTYDGSHIYISTDKGLSWHPCSNETGGRIDSEYSAGTTNIAFGNNRFLVIIYHYPYFSIDNGENWQKASFYFPNTISNEDNLVYIENDKFLYLSKSYGIKYTTDGGLTWVDSYTGSLSSTIPAHGDGVLIVSASNSIIRSLDGGETWETVSQSSLGPNVCYGDGIFMICGSSTNTYYSTDRGLTWINIISPHTFRSGAICYGNGRFVGGGERVPDSSPTEYYTQIFTAQYDKCYTTDQTPTTSSTVYSEPNVTSSYTISSVASGSITLSNNNTYYYNQSGNVQTYDTVGNSHPEYLCFIDGVGVKMGNTVIATNNSNS